MKKVLSVLAGAVLLFGSAGIALADYAQYNFTITPSSGPDFTVQVNQPTLTQPSLFGIAQTSGIPTSFKVGNGLEVSGGDTLQVWDVQSSAVETLDGFKSDTQNSFVNLYSDLADATSSLSALSSGLATLSTTVSGISAPFNIGNFFTNNASTSPYVASSTKNGLISAAMASKLIALNASTSISYEGTTQHVNSFPIFKSATVSSGVAVFNMTTDGTSGAASLCPNGVIQDSVNPSVNDATASYQMSWTWSNSNKTLTITTNKLTTANILTGILGQSTANTAVVKVTVWCY